jgi:hypothetical protein
MLAVPLTSGASVAATDGAPYGGRLLTLSVGRVCKGDHGAVTLEIVIRRSTSSRSFSRALQEIARRAPPSVATTVSQ